MKKGLTAARTNTRALQVLMLKLISFGFAKRLELRKQFVLAAYDKCFADSSAQDPSWNEELLTQVAKTVGQDPLLGKIREDLTRSLLSLAEADDCLLLQKAALTLLMQDASQDEELQRILANTHILASDYAVRCFNTICVCDGHIRSEAQNLSKAGDGKTEGNTDAITMVLKSLTTLVQMLDPGQHAHCGEDEAGLVSELRQLLRSREVCSHVIDILRIPFERVKKQGGMDELKDPGLVQVIKTCYDFIREFCREDPINQEEVFASIMEPLMQHLNVKQLTASEALSAAVENNATLLDKLPEKLLRRFFAGIARCGKIARFLRFLKITTSIHGKPYRRTQDLVLKLLQDEKELILELDGNKGASGAEDEVAAILGHEGEETRFEMMMRKEYEEDDSFLEYHVECFELLAKCAAGNRPENAGRKGR